MYVRDVRDLQRPGPTYARYPAGCHRPERPNLAPACGNGAGSTWRRTANTDLPPNPAADRFLPTNATAVALTAIAAERDPDRTSGESPSYPGTSDGKRRRERRSGVMYWPRLNVMAEILPGPGATISGWRGPILVPSASVVTTATVVSVWFPELSLRFDAIDPLEHLECSIPTHRGPFGLPLRVCCKPTPREPAPAVRRHRTGHSRPEAAPWAAAGVQARGFRRPPNPRLGENTRNPDH